MDVDTRANGAKVSSTVRVFSHGRRVQDTRATTKRTKSTAKESLSATTGQNTEANGKMGKSMAEVHTPMSREKKEQEPGRTA